MKTKLLAAVASFSDDGNCTMLGFADDPTHPVDYVILQMTDAPDAEDLSYSWGGVHIDGGALGVYGYDLVRDIRESKDRVILTLTDAAQRRGIGADIEITSTAEARSAIPLSVAVDACTARLRSWEAANAKPG